MTMSAHDDLLALYLEALDHQLSGRTVEARAGYQALLAAQPAHAEANHNLGMLEFAAGNAEAALDRLMSAVEANPRQGQLWQGLVEVLRALGADEHAEQAILQAAEAGLDPAALAALRGPVEGDHVPTPQPHPEPGPSVDATIRERARLVADRSAPGIARQVARSRPLDRKKGERMVTLFMARRYADLEALALQITRELPNNPAGWHFLGNARLARGDLLAGLLNLLKANELFPGDAQLLGHLGAGLAKLGYFAEADECLQRSEENRHPSKRTVLGHLEVLRNHVVCKLRLNQISEARRIADDFVALTPEYGVAHYSLASVLIAQGAMQDAIPHLERATVLNPTLMEAFQDLGLTFFNAGRLDDAVRVTEQAIEKNPGVWQAHSNLLFFLSHDERINPHELLRRHIEFGEQFESPLRDEWRPHDNVPDPDRKLKVGFVSADFNGHAVASFIEPILAHMDRSRIDLYGFYNNLIYDATTSRIKPMFRVWIDVANVSDRDFAEIIRVARIDILIDLSGHTAGTRLLTFARRPAPVQVSCIGYPDTTGLRSMDYYVADRYIAPPGSFDELFTEKLLRVDSAASFSFPPHAPEPAPLPAIGKGYVTFGSFNRPSKITVRTLDLWTRLMGAIPNARILLGAIDGEKTRQTLTAEFERRGISSDRLDFLPRMPIHRYLAAHKDVDILLDTFPFNAGTTAIYSMWMGVPVLTMTGDRYVSNIGAGLMTKIGLEEYVAEDENDFVARGVAHACNIAQMASLRATLRNRLEALPHFMPAHVARGYEDAFRRVWAAWCEQTAGG